MQAAYWTILLMLAAGAALWRPAAISRVIAAMVGCGIASLVLASFLVWTGDNYGIAMMAVDGVAAFIVLKPPPSLWQAIIGATYLTQIGLHAGRIITHPSDTSSYYLGLSFMALLQLAVVGGWWLDERLLRRRPVHGPGAAPAPAHREGDGG
ncbi:MAG: hypothetical protein V4527_18375 [Pseudomonadota bacterium]